MFSFSVRLTNANILERFPPCSLPILIPNRQVIVEPILNRLRCLYLVPSVSSDQVVSAGEPDSIGSIGPDVQSLSTSQFDLSWHKSSSSMRFPWKRVAWLVHGLSVFLWFWLGWRKRTHNQRKEKASQNASIRSRKIYSQK